MFIVESFVLGLLIALNPCQLAINVSALTYLNTHSDRSDELMRKAWLYALGRCLSYSVLGIVLMWLVRCGLNVKEVQPALSVADELLPYIFIIIGVFLFYRAFHVHRHHGENCHNSGATIKRGGPYGSLLLGVLLALAFCPESAILYFGIMLPLGVSNAFGWLAPISLAIAAAIPIMAIALIMSKAGEKVVRIAASFNHFQQWMNALFGSAFIVVAVILLLS